LKKPQVSAMIDTHMNGGVMEKGDDIITTFLGGCLFLVVSGIIFISVLSWIF
jgi:hypothetical protein